MRGVVGTTVALDRLRRALDQLEGYPRQGRYADGRTPPPGKGITETIGRVCACVEGTALEIPVAVVRRHEGKQVTVDGVPVTIPTEAALVEIRHRDGDNPVPGAGPRGPE